MRVATGCIRNAVDCPPRAAWLFHVHRIAAVSAIAANSAIAAISNIAAILPLLPFQPLLPSLPFLPLPPYTFLVHLNLSEVCRCPAAFASDQPGKHLVRHTMVVQLHRGGAGPSCDGLNGANAPADGGGQPAAADSCPGLPGAAGAAAAQPGHGCSHARA